MAAEVVHFGNSRGPTKKGDTLRTDSNQFDIRVRLPIHGPFEAAYKQLYPDEIEIHFVHEKVVKGENAGGPSFVKILNNMVSPILVEFFESHHDWISQQFGATDAWPPLLNFARVIRNACSHQGKLEFRNPNAKPVSWHHLNYDPSQNGREIIGTDLSFADMIILMVEVGDELDYLGAPHL